MRHVAGVALAFLLVGAGLRLVGVSTIVTEFSVRQAVRAAPIHPFGAALGLLAVPLTAACLLAARCHSHHIAARYFRAWSLREL